jgi:ribose transport system substrate-binding protein
MLILGTMLSAGCAAAKDDGAVTETSTEVSTVAESEETATEAKAISIGFSMKTLNNPYFVSLVDAVKQLSAEAGWECTVLDANNDTSKEAQNIETFITNGVDLIFLDSVDPSACVPSINAAAENNIPVINLDSGVDECDQCTTVYSDNYQNGRLVGKAYGEFVAADEEIIAVLLSALKGNIACLERRLGLYAGIIEARTGCTEEESAAAAQQMEDDLLANGSARNEAANFTLRGQGWGAGTREEGLVAAEDLITANMDLTCVLGENDQMLFGAMEALENAKIEGVDLVAAADGAQEAYDYIKEGKYFGTGENSPFKVAEKGMEIAKEILIDGADWRSYPDVILTEAVAVTIDNVDERYEFGF